VCVRVWLINVSAHMPSSYRVIVYGEIIGLKGEYDTLSIYSRSIEVEQLRHAILFCGSTPVSNRYCVPLSLGGIYVLRFDIFRCGVGNAPDQLIQTFVINAEGTILLFVFCIDFWNQ
jgi:hypothetical protein